MGSLPAGGVCWEASAAPSRGAVPKERQKGSVLTGFRNGDYQDDEAWDLQCQEKSSFSDWQLQNRVRVLVGDEILSLSRRLGA